MANSDFSSDKEVMLALKGKTITWVGRDSDTQSWVIRLHDGTMLHLFEFENIADPQSYMSQLLDEKLEFAQAIVDLAKFENKDSDEVSGEQTGTN